MRTVRLYSASLVAKKTVEGGGSVCCPYLLTRESINRYTVDLIETFAVGKAHLVIHRHPQTGAEQAAAYVVEASRAFD